MDWVAIGTVVVSVAGSAALVLWKGGGTSENVTMRLKNAEESMARHAAALKEHEAKDDVAHKVLQEHATALVAMERDQHAARSREQTATADLAMMKAQLARTYEAVIRIEAAMEARRESTGKHDRIRGDD